MRPKLGKDGHDVDLRARNELWDAVMQSRKEELDELHRAYRPRREWSLLSFWLRGWLHRAPPIVPQPLPDVTGGQVSVSFAGHSTVLLRYADAQIVCDPMLGSHLGAIPRLVPPGLGAAELAHVDVLLVGNAAPDHLHIPTLRRLPRTATLVVPAPLARRVARLGFAHVVELDVGRAWRGGSVEITAVPARYGGGRACSYVVRGPGPSVFFCGDGGYFSGFADVGRRYHPDLALLPIGGYAPIPPFSMGRAAGSFREDHMSPLDAIYAFEDLGARMLIPIHHGAFPLSYERLQEPIDWLASLVHQWSLKEYVTILDVGASRRFASPR
jgi:L-ascorbate metabolism protein UlaG (beta-lactamase superfamily)